MKSRENLSQSIPILPLGEITIEAFYVGKVILKVNLLLKRMQ
jgi:hypothetical protein